MSQVYRQLADTAKNVFQRVLSFKQHALWLMFQDKASMCSQVRTGQQCTLQHYHYM